MTSGSILPTSGPPPPEFRRVIVPENLRPKLASEIAEQSSRQNPPARPAAENRAQTQENQAADTLLQLAGQQQSDAENRQVNSISVTESQPPPSTNLGGASAVAVQVQEAEPAPAVAIDPEEQELIGELTDEEKAIVEELKERDREVRSHENAHAAAGGGYAGTPTYEYTRGPDGIQYAIGGQVQIDVSEVPGDPEATLAKMEVVRRAALAPAQPSGQDRAVAAQAEAQAREAQAEIAEQQKEERLGATDEATGATGQASIRELVENDENGSGFGDQPQSPGFGVTSVAGTSPAPQTISIDLLV